MDQVFLWLDFVFTYADDVKIAILDIEENKLYQGQTLTVYGSLEIEGHNFKITMIKSYLPIHFGVSQTLVLQ